MRGVLLGCLSEVGAKAGTGKAIRTMFGLQARTARVVRDGAETGLAIEDALPGNVSPVRSGEKIPVDGTATEGYSAVGELMMSDKLNPAWRTGERRSSHELRPFSPTENGRCRSQCASTRGRRVLATKSRRTYGGA